MDFREALQVLQNRSAGPMEAAARPPPGDGMTATTGTTPVMCVDCAADDGDGGADAASQPPSDVATLSDAGLVQLFLTRQEERVAVYRKFEDGFQLFLQVTEAGGYEALVQRTTATFAMISVGVNQVEVELKKRGAAAQAVALMLRRVQTLEREKLLLTARHQILRHGIALDSLHTDGASGVDEASKEARAGAMRADEAKEVGARLEALRGELNDALDEVRCELAESFDDEEVVEEGKAMDVAS